PAVLYSIVSFVLRPAPTATLFPYTTLFRSAERGPRAILARQLDQRVAPHRLAERESRALTEQPAVQARRDHDQRLLAQPAREGRSEEHTSELQSLAYLVCRLLLEKKKNNSR